MVPKSLKRQIGHPDHNSSLGLVHLARLEGRSEGGVDEKPNEITQD